MSPVPTGESPVQDGGISEFDLISIHPPEAIAEPEDEDSDSSDDSPPHSSTSHSSLSSASLSSLSSASLS
ncbi:MAG: hypothetical protein MHMPM18_002737 [Marteilia pararefringens]